MVLLTSKLSAAATCSSADVTWIRPADKMAYHAIMLTLGSQAGKMAEVALTEGKMGLSSLHSMQSVTLVPHSSLNRAPEATLSGAADQVQIMAEAEVQAEAGRAVLTSTGI